MFHFVFVVCWVGSGLCDGLINRSEEFHPSCVCVCDLETLTMRLPGLDVSCCAKITSTINFLHTTWPHKTTRGQTFPDSNTTLTTGFSQQLFVIHTVYVG